MIAIFNIFLEAGPHLKERALLSSGTIECRVIPHSEAARFGAGLVVGQCGSQGNRFLRPFASQAPIANKNEMKIRLLESNLRPIKGVNMPIQLDEENGGKLLAAHVNGKLTKEDYEHFVPEFERLVRRHGKLRVLFDMTDFHGWDAGAL